MISLLYLVAGCFTLMVLAIVWNVRLRQARRRRQLMIRLMTVVAAPVWISNERHELHASAC